MPVGPGGPDFNMDQPQRPNLPPLPQISSHPGVMAIDITDKFATAAKSEQYMYLFAPGGAKPLTSRHRFVAWRPRQRWPLYPL